MRFQRLDLNLLVALDALLAEGTITEAASRLNMSQSAMSSALGRLRTYFGDPLFVQVGRRMMATQLARELEQPVREALLHIQTRIASRPAFDPVTVSRDIGIATSDYFVHVAGARLVRRLQTAAPGLRLAFWPIDGGSQGKLDRGEVDLIVSPRHLLVGEKPSADLFDDDFVAIACARNTRVQPRLDAAVFQALGHVVCQFGPNRNHGLDQEWIDRAGLSRRCEVTIENFSMLPPLVVGTQRIAMMQRRLAALYAGLMPIGIAELPFPTHFVEAMQWQRFNQADPLHAWLRQAMVNDLAAISLHSPEL